MIETICHIISKQCQKPHWIKQTPNVDSLRRTSVWIKEVCREERIVQRRRYKIKFSASNPASSRSHKENKWCKHTLLNFHQQTQLIFTSASQSRDHRLCSIFFISVVVFSRFQNTFFRAVAYVSVPKGRSCSNDYFFQARNSSPTDCSWYNFGRGSDQICHHR